VVRQYRGQEISPSAAGWLTGTDRLPHGCGAGNAVAVVAGHFGITRAQLLAGGKHRMQRRVAFYMGFEMSGRRCRQSAESAVVSSVVRLAIAWALAALRLAALLPRETL
jgi:hypothetical protein